MLRGHQQPTQATKGPQVISDDPAIRDSTGIIAPPPLIYLAGLLLGFVAGWLRRPPALAPAAAMPVGAVLVLAGLAVSVSFERAFSRARTTLDARGPATTLVTGGPFRFSRNPGYLGMALICTGIALAAGATWALVTLIPTLVLIDRGVIAREEPYLERTFGREYTRFKARVRRWL